MYAPNPNFKAGTTLDDFHLERLVATSGMASVFDAKSVSTGERVAIKIPHPEVESDPALWERFMREEEIGIRLHHPSVMKIYANPGRSQVYLVMEWIEGQLLRQILTDYKSAHRTMETERAVQLCIAICHALEHIHANGVAHRDLKPENIMVDAQGHIHLIDFGIASDVGARRLTFAHFSQSLGTPDYISPEQVRGKRGDARSDIYSLGIILYEMLTGIMPFSGSNPLVVMNDRLLNMPPAPRSVNPQISPQLQEVLYRALEREPKNRYSHARELVHDLEHQEQVGIAERAETVQPRRRRSPEMRRVMFVLIVGLIPILIFALLLAVAHHQ